jgi:hypothetical protein
VKIWAGSIWLGTGTHKRFLWIQQWTSSFHNRQGLPPPLYEQLLDSEGLCSMQWLTWHRNRTFYHIFYGTKYIQQSKQRNANLWNHKSVL